MTSTALAQPREGVKHRYELEATLRPETHTVEGRGRIFWTNESPVPIGELWLHLYLNAFASDRTVFMRESKGELRGVRFASRGSIEVTTLRIRGGADLLPRARTDVVPDDETQMRVPLPSPVMPGESIELETTFVSQLPEVFARSGYSGDFHMVAQWFPKIARLDPDGTWASFPYHGHGEFYADFGTYDLRVTTPRGWVVGATGRQIAEASSGSSVTRRFVAENVHDTAFCAWPHFEEITDTDGGVAIRVLHPPGYHDAARRHLEVTRAGLRHYGARYGEYPHPIVTVIVPPRGADGAAGMEYPTLFTTSGPWWRIPGVHVTHDHVTAHELGHQWFQGIVASNEVAWPMLDEGMTEWATWDFMRELHGARASAMSWPMRFDGYELMRIVALKAGEDTPPPGRAAHQFDSAADYGRSVYARTATVLETVARSWGRPRFVRAVGTYARRHRFGHPKPDDLFRAFDEQYWPGFSARVLRPALMDGATAAVKLTAIETTAGGTRIRGEREGTLPVPTWVELHLEDGTTRRVPWPGAEQRFDHTEPAPVIGARANPDRAILLDDTSLDDGKRRETVAGSDRGLTARLLFALQSFLSLVGV